MFLLLFSIRSTAWLKYYPTEQREQLSHALTLFIPYWAQTSPQHAQNVTRLDDAQKQQSLVEDISKTGSDENALDVAAAVQVGAVLDLPLMHTRASLFLFLNSLVRRLFTLAVLS